MSNGVNGITNGTGTRPTSLLKAGHASRDSLRAAVSGVLDGSIDAQDIHDFLQGVRLDEIVTLSQSKLALHTVKEDSSFPASFYVPLWSYIKYLYETWGNIVSLILHMDIPFTDLLITIAFALLTSTILFFALLWCQFATNPFISRLYFDWANKNAHGLGLVNAAYPKLFNALTPEQVEAAKKQLSLPIEKQDITKDMRVFDLDVAKFLLQLSSVVYERAPVAIHSTLEAVSSCTKQTAPQTHHSSASATSAKRNTIHRPPSGPSGTAPPRAPSPSGGPSPTPHTPIISHSPGGTQIKESAPGCLVRDIFPDQQASRIEKAFKDCNAGHGVSAITDFCERMGVEYEPVSELNSSSSAYASFFWDEKSNWIVVCFKGTGIADYADWVTDLTVTMEPVSDFLPGYSRAIRGFKERIYPTAVSSLGGTRPWDTIRYSLCKVSEKLAHKRADEGKEGKINVWFTGHSLGCALASLAYARAFNTPSDFAGYPITLRDCYIFAAPVAADRASAIKFNEDLAKDGHVRTMWRVRNAGDAVATLLPQLGDRSDLVSKLSPTNPAGFAHLGAEIIMKDGPSNCHVASPTSHFLGMPSDYDAAPTPIHVEIRSQFTKGEIEKARRKVLKEKGEEAREKFFIWAEKIPLIGRFIAHDTVCYWDQLDRIVVGPTKWVASSP